MAGDQGADAVGSLGVALLERTAELEPVLASAGDARRLVRSFLDELGRAEWLDAAELAVSEVVTNAALHAHTTIELRLLAYRDRARVEVRDRNPRLPRRAEYDDQATTGRGMALVAALSLECGVVSLGPSGKVVWFCVGDSPEPSAEDLLEAWDDDTWDDGAAAPADEGAEAGSVTVVLSAMPPTLWSSARQHHDALLRELLLHRTAHGRPVEDLTPVDRARTLISDAVRDAIAVARTDEALAPALPDGARSPLPRTPAALDIRIAVQRDAGWQFAALRDALDEAEALALGGELLLSPGLPEIVAVRDWACEQVIAQLDGAGPVPWGGADQARFTDEVRPSAEELRWEASVVEMASTPVVAADERNQIVAVSRSLADLLGWRVEDLIGRRVVTLVPPALREAHVAGFSRHLTTGEAHVLGVPTELPVLTADGRELPCRFLIEVAPSAAGRTVYVAWIDPL